MELIIAFILISFSYEDCYDNCKTCFENSLDFKNMKCIKCKDDLNVIFNTFNCDYKEYYLNYYLNKSDSILYPCSLLENQNCYECDPYLNTKGKCLSCNKGFIFNNETNECQRCKENEIPIIKGDFYNCNTTNKYEYCDLYKTECIASENSKIICPDDAPFYNIINKSCNEYGCQDNELDEEVCLANSNKYKDRILFINWFQNEPKYINYPSYNVDNSGYLLIELTGDIGLSQYNMAIPKNQKRKLIFLNEEGRGIFDEINDIYEKDVELEKNVFRFLSTSTALRSTDSEKYSYLLNLETYGRNIEFINLKTGEISSDFIFNIFVSNGINIENIVIPSIQLMELNNKNQYLIATCELQNVEGYYFPFIFWYIFSLNISSEESINVYSLESENIESKNHFYLALGGYQIDVESKFFFVLTKKENMYVTVLLENHLLVLYIIDMNNLNKYIPLDYLFKNAFHKLVNIKDEMNFLCYFSNKYPQHNYLSILIFEINDDKFSHYFSFTLFTMVQGYCYNADLIFLSEIKAIFAALHWNGKKISLYVLNFFDNYNHVMTNIFNLNFPGKSLKLSQRFSLLFKYKDILGFQVENIDRENGFILFGYFNSTDPKQIYNIKKDGLNYNINLRNYLTLQSNIFAYEIKCIKIVEVPNLNNSGIYLISNNTKNILQKNDYIGINTIISINFEYNGKIKKGNYLFKFVGVLQEPTFEYFNNYSDQMYFDVDDDELKDKYIKEYNERRNMNITGRVALVQINVLNDIKVFCDKNYDDTALKDEDGKFITCGEGKFYDVANENEITQLYLGKNYYFDYNTSSYIKCHERCETCSREYNNTHMNCDECHKNFFKRDDNCFEISNCDYNYYYDFNYNLKCINSDTSCPDFKPYEYNMTKECIENCEIDEFNNICNPTNNIISINETKRKIIENVDYLNLNEKLLKNKEKYIITGNNVTFIFTTSEIEKIELYNNYNNSSILLNDFEKILKQKYLIPDDLSIPILKIETYNNHSNILQVSYELYNPLNLTQKLDLYLFNLNYIEIRIPMVIKSYKMDLILKAKNLGYNIFDLNDSFYHDICSVFTYNNSDISLSERKNLLDLSDENICIDNCNNTNFDIKTLKSICLCKIGYNNNDTYLIKDEIYNNNSENSNLFNSIKTNIDFSKASNIRVIKCVSVIFNKKLFIQNYGFYIMFFMNVFNIIILILSPLSKAEIQFNNFCSEVKKQMDDIYKNINLKKNKEKTNINSNIDIIESRNIKDRKILKNKKKDENKNKKIVHEISSLRGGSTNLCLNKIQTQVNYNIEKDNEKKKIKELKKKEGIDFYIYNLIKYIDYEKRKNYLSEYEIENLSYKDALQIENRNKSNYYFALLQEKNKIISIFLNEQDYNIYNVKLSLFIFNFNLSMTINALFFNDEAIYEINQDNGSYNLSTQISGVLYSAIISAFINSQVESLAFSHKNIIKLRYNKDIISVIDKTENLIKKLKIKYILYFGMTIFFNAIFFYYITAFCAIYSIIQTHMISDSIMSFLLTMSYSIVLSLISTIIRVSSLKKENKFRHLLYIISWIISLI